MVTSAVACPEYRLRLIDEQKSQRAIVGPLAALGKQVAHLALGFTHPHVQDFRAFDVQEKFGAIHAGLGFDLLPKIVGRGLADEVYPATHLAQTCQRGEEHSRGRRERQAHPRGGGGLRLPLRRQGAERTGRTGES